MFLLQGSRTFATELPKMPTTRATKVLQVWKAGTLSEGLRIASGKLQRSTCQRSGQQVLPSSLTGPDEITLVACVNNRLATISGEWCGVSTKVNLEISDGVRTKVVHVNRIRHRLQPQPGDDASPADDSKGHNSWVPPQIDHFIDEIGVPDNPSQERRYPQSTRNLPERYGPYLCHACGQA